MIGSWVLRELGWNQVGQSLQLFSDSTDRSPKTLPPVEGRESSFVGRAPVSNGLFLKRAVGAGSLRVWGGGRRQPAALLETSTVVPVLRPPGFVILISTLGLQCLVTMGPLL